MQVAEDENQNESKDGYKSDIFIKVKVNMLGN